MPDNAISDKPSSDAALRRDDVMRAAAEVFLDKGYGATSINQIAEHMGCTKGKLYYYYASKYELYLDIHTTAMLLTTQRCAAARDRETATDRRLWALVHEQVTIILEGSPIMRVATQGLERFMLRLESGPTDKVARRLLNLRADFEAMYADLIRSGVDEGLFPASTDPQLSAKLALGVVNWMVIWASPRKRAKRTAETISSSAANFVLAGLRGLPGALPG
jgi:AcrR family transcriptional regulator